jgi:hypothetical protein
MRYEIRRPVSVTSIAVLAAIIAFCPTLMCAPPEIGAAAHSCCPKSQPHKQGPPPCDTSSQTCPYLLLQKAKSVPPTLGPPPLEMTAVVPQMEYFEPITIAPSHVPDVKDLYLRNRVLLI